MDTLHCQLNGFLPNRAYAGGIWQGGARPSVDYKCMVAAEPASHIHSHHVNVVKHTMRSSSSSCGCAHHDLLALRL